MTGIKNALLPVQIQVQNPRDLEEFVACIALLGLR
jgi:hypothetical protein